MIKNSETKIVRVEQLGTFKDLTDSTIAKLSMIMSLSAVTSTISSTNNGEWKIVYTDSKGGVLFGVKQDGSWMLCADIDDIMDFVVSSFTTKTGESTSDSTT